MGKTFWRLPEFLIWDYNSLLYCKAQQNLYQLRRCKKNKNDPKTAENLRKKSSQKITKIEETIAIELPTKPQETDRTVARNIHGMVVTVKLARVVRFLTQPNKQLPVSKESKKLYCQIDSMNLLTTPRHVYLVVIRILEGY